MIVAVAIVIAPATIPGEIGTLRFIVNVSSPSTMSSSITAMFTVLLLLPAVITAVCGIELKSTSPPETTVRSTHYNYPLLIISVVRIKRYSFFVCLLQHACMFTDYCCQLVGCMEDVESFMHISSLIYLHSSN